MRPASAAALVAVGIAALAACDRRGDVPLVAMPARLYAPPDPATLPATAAPAAGHDAGYVGPEACVECHADRAASVRRTSHWNTSAPVSRDTVQASLGADDGVRTAGGLRIDVSERGGELWQTAIDEARDERLSRRMDVVIGSGKIAQTFLSWEKDRLYELPVTWFAKVGWRFSPGYWEDRADFARPVYGQCLECHALWAEPGNPEQVHDNAFVGKIYWGVTCEKCHGPGREHVEWARAHPQAKEGEHVIVPSELTRERSDDVCLLCHSSRGDNDVKPVFTFRPGDELRAHYSAGASASAGALGASVTLHSFEQGDRLHESRCWKESPSMTCITCHNPHRSERGNDAGFSARCLGCHEPAKLSQKAGDSRHSGKTACLDCHMPLRGTEAERRPGHGAETRAQMRDHRIGIY